MTSAQEITEAQAAELLINWELAASTAARLAPPGPRLTRGEAAAEVQALREAATEAVGHVHQITGLHAARGLGEDTSDVLIVDRAGWSAANAESFRQMLAPALKAAVEKKPELAKEGSTGQVVGSAVTGAELGAVLAFLSANVLGQFEPFHQQRLLLVAPNVVDIATQLNVDRADFRLWVCLHEQTHRVQFAAAPWLAEHLQEQITQLSTNTMGQADSLPQKLAEAAKQFKAELKGGKDTGHDGASADPSAGGASSTRPRNRLLEAIQSPEDRAVMSHLTAVMSLLEGHANVVMDAVDASIVPSVKTIRRRFNDRGRRRSPLERAVRKLLQLDMKAAQYRDGQKFVSHIVDAVGMEAFNTIWEAPQHLPTEDELHQPDLWIQRMGLQGQRSGG
ncbi:zinc-dependent metalloprotease [Nesterenkonia massiliensis]|uniref:Zinc-dependent metalloprotease n=1 Tax=Nesterenkonia massiliensis TaxID=1232429 RepID=A0ABT2HQL6_9MICC|nr:zinc-dependent metalloprotease [Nesterenkonia massiliensis]MCT1606990.1 zinc-dependent metalloprotease [Nesterenkonia massiliensis]